MREKELLSEILNNTKEIKETLDEHSKRLTSLENNVTSIKKEHGERLTSLENIVTLMQKEHGEKLQVLFDYFVDQDNKHKDINSEIFKLNKTLDRHDSRIFALEFYKKEKLASE